MNMLFFILFRYLDFSIILSRIQDVRRSGQIPGLKDSCSRVRDAQGWRPWRKKWMV